MRAQISKWGNSLGVRVPKDLAVKVGLVEGAQVEIEAEGGRIVISLPTPRYALAELLEGVTPEAMGEAFDWGPDAGREIIE